VEEDLPRRRYDLILLRRDYGWHLHNLFRHDVGGAHLGYKQFGLAGMLEKRVRRAAPASASEGQLVPPCCRRRAGLRSEDTHYLPGLRDRLAAELAARGLLTEALETFAEQSRVKMPNSGFDPDAFWHLNGVFDMNPTQQAALKALYAFRDREARRRNAPHFKVLGDQTLLEVATRRPRG
jgi:ribonuclease D